MSPQRILIIEDDAPIRETVQIALDAVGYRTETAADGHEGLQKFGSGEPWDLVLLDQRMPAMEGLEVLRRMRERDPSARIVMVSAYGTIELAVDAMKAGAMDFLRKPFTPEVLRGAVKATLAHPRQPVTTTEHELTRLMPPAPRVPPSAARLPLIHFRTLNGYKYWSIPMPQGAEETEALRVRRAFMVKAPSGEEQRCVVEITTSVRELIREETRRDYPAGDPFWDTVCKGALSHHLWTQAQMPAEILPVYELTREQLHVVRRLAGLGPRPF